MKWLDDSDCRMESLPADNAHALEMCKEHQVDYLLIDAEYNVDLKL